MQVNWLPMALCTSTAATEESTPPESPQITWPVPTFSRIAATVVSMKCAGVQSPRAPQMLKEISDQLRAQRRVVHLGMELHRPDAALLVGDSGQRVRGDGDAAKARGQLQRLVAVAHPDLDRRRQPGKQRRRAVFNRHFGVAVLALGRRAHLAAQVMHDEVQPVADAQHRHAQLPARAGRRPARRRRKPTTARPRESIR